MTAFFNCVESAFKLTKNLLWPFHSKVWLKLALLLFFSGSLGGNFGAKLPAFAPKAAAVEQAEDKPINATIQQWKGKSLNLWQNYRTLVIALMGAGSVLLLLFFVMMIWLTSRLQMVLMRILATNQVIIRETWRQTRELGQSLFIFNLTVSLVAMAVLVLLALSWVWVGVLSVVVFIVALPGLWILYRFLPVLMEARRIEAKPAFYELMYWLKGHIHKALVNFLLYAVFAIGISVFVVMIAVIVMVVVGGAFALGGVGVWFLIKGLGMFAKVLAVAAAVFGGALLLLITIVLFSVPVGTFFTYLRMELVRRELQA